MSGRRWIAGYNRPGYLPDFELLAEFADFGEAVQFLAEELQLEAERLADANPAPDESTAPEDDCEELARRLRDGAPPNRDWSGMAAGFEWWIKESPNAA